LDRGQPVRVLIADDHPLTREGLALAIRSALPGVVIDHAGSIGEAETIIQGHHGQYRLLLLDLVLPDARGFSGFLKLQHLLGPVPIAIVSAREEPMLIDAARALGAVGFLPKSRPLDELAEMVRTVASGGHIFPDLPGLKAASPAATARSRMSTLSGAQLRVLLALADGRLNKQIAGDLQVTEATVKAHLTAIFRKLGVSNRTQALLAMQPLLGETAGEPELP
jgi:DNA-binding NarL/FixJ family response regulator